MVEPVQSRGEARASGGRERLAAAVVAGLLGAAAVVAFMMLAAAVQDVGLLAPLRPMGAAFRGDDAATGGAGAIAYGLALHAIGAVLLALPLAFLLRREESTGAAMVMGAAYALVVMSLAVTFVLPAADPVMSREMSRLGGSWVIAWGLYGAALGLIPALRRGGTRRPRRLGRAAAPESDGAVPPGSAPGPARA